MLGNLQGALQGAELTMCAIYCNLSMFLYTSPSKPVLMAGKQPTAGLQRVCLQTDALEDPFLLFISVARRMGFIFVYMFVCTVGNDGTPGLFIHVCLRSSFFFF